MAPTYFPLRWESTGDQWWYASPIDWAAANGHYDLVRELLRMDGNHLMKLTSLRRIRRLETVWDDDEQFHGAAKCRSSVARRLFLDCEAKHHKQPASKNSLLKAGYGGWLIYTAASAGDLGFVHDLLERNPLLVFGEGEYGVTDILYAAARSKSREVFAAVMESAAVARGGDVYRWEVMNRAVHAAARGGNMAALKELLLNCSDVLAYRDALGSTLLHTASARAQVEIIKFLIDAFEKITASTDYHGNTALHVAAFRGQLAAVEVLIEASPTLIYANNNAGETFLHKAVSGFQTLQFRRLDRQIDLLKHLLRRGAGAEFRIGAVINSKSNEQRTALHLAVIGNVHSDLVQLLMTAEGIDVNATDADGLTPLDYLRQKPRSPSSDVLIRQLISAGADDHFHRTAAARRIFVSRLKMQQGSGGSSPGSSFRIPDAEIFLYTGIENASDFFAGSGSIISPASPELSPSHRRRNSNNDDSAANLDNQRSSFTGSAKPSSVNNAAQLFKQVLLNWPNKLRDKKSKHINNNNKSIDYDDVPIDYHQPNKPNASELDPPTPLRKRFSKPSSPSQSSNKRTLAVRSNQSSPTSKKKKLRNSALQAIVVPRRSSRSSSFSKSSISSSSPPPIEKQKGSCAERDIAGPSCPSNNNNNGNSKRMKSQYYLCFGNSGLSVKSPVNRPNTGQSFKRPVSLVA